MQLSSQVFVQIATWTEVNHVFDQVSFIRWCSQQELNNLPLCHKDNSFRCNIKSLTPLAPHGSNYRYDYSLYSFDIVTIQVKRSTKQCVINNSEISVLLYV